MGSGESAAGRGSSPRAGQSWDAASAEGVTAVYWLAAGLRANTPYPKAPVRTPPPVTAVPLASRGRAVRPARDRIRRWEGRQAACPGMRPDGRPTSAGMPRGSPESSSGSRRRCGYSGGCGPAHGDPHVVSIAEILTPVASCSLALPDLTTRGRWRVCLRSPSGTSRPRAGTSSIVPVDERPGSHPSSSPSSRDRATAWLREEAPSLW